MQQQNNQSTLITCLQISAIVMCFYVLTACRQRGDSTAKAGEGTPTASVDGYIQPFLVYNSTDDATRLVPGVLIANRAALIANLKTDDVVTLIDGNRRSEILIPIVTGEKAVTFVGFEKPSATANLQLATPTAPAESVVTQKASQFKISKPLTGFQEALMYNDIGFVSGLYRPTPDGGAEFYLRNEVPRPYRPGGILEFLRRLFFEPWSWRELFTNTLSWEKKQDMLRKGGAVILDYSERIFTKPVPGSVDILAFLDEDRSYVYPKMPINEKLRRPDILPEAIESAINSAKKPMPKAVGDQIVKYLDCR